MCRCLKGTPGVAQKAKIATDLDNVANVYVDSDWAGMREDPQGVRTGGGREVHTDSRSLGKLRHVEFALLWLKVHVQSGKAILRRMAGLANLADFFTKHLTLAESTKHSTRLRCGAVWGRSTQLDAAQVEVGRPECHSATRTRGV